MRIAKFFISILLFFCFSSVLSGQSIELKQLEIPRSSALNQLFYDFHLVSIDFDQLKAPLSNRGNQHFITLKHPEFQWDLELFEHDVHSSRYVFTVASDKGIEVLRRKPANKSMIGYLKSKRGGEARMVVADKFIAGMVVDGGATYFIEQANSIDPTLPENYLVVYNIENVFQNNKIHCGFDLYSKNKQELEEKVKDIELETRSHCLQVEIAIANDFTVFQKKGSQANVENWNTTILTLLQANYDDEFQHGLEFVQSAGFVATSNGSDPWNGINNINAHLDKHVMWGNGGGYNGAYDVATAWTTKYTNGAVGLAWLGVICNNLRYNVCSDYGGSNGCLKQLMAHELGHNFNADHDGSGQPFIMAPSVNCTNAWSSNSVSKINAHVNSRGCLSICAGGSPPVANFVGTPKTDCVPFVVEFTDLSSNDPTAWQWTFPGGNPSSSNQQDPTVTYNNYGEYDVTLKVTNSFGSNTITFKKYIFAKDKPIADFSKVIIERFVYFTNKTFYGGTYEWDFGDGQVSYERDPIHLYTEDGKYTVTLLADNECGISQTSMVVDIVTSPIALFTADTTYGCASYTVKYTNLSSTNVTSWEWEFPGGNPSKSALFEPTVEYDTAGVFDVKLTAKNSKYKAVAHKQKYITVDSLPSSDFSFITRTDTVDFTSKAKYAKSWIWNFGDGSSGSNQQNPSHVFTPGTYDVVLIVKNACGNDTLSQQVKIGSGLNAAFKADTLRGCAPFVVQFTNNSSAATSYKWTFPGGIPSTSTDKNPVVRYDTAGKYDVELVAGNGNEEKSDVKREYIEVIETPVAGFEKSIAGYKVFYSNQSKHGKTYHWDFGDNMTSNESSPEHSYASEGDYNVRLIVSNECGNDTIDQLVAVYLIPRVDFTADTTIICGSGSVQFISKTSADVIETLWQFDGGTPDESDLKNPIVFYDKKGIYSVKLSVKNSNGPNAIIKSSYIKVISPVLCPENIFTKTDALNPGDHPIKTDGNHELQLTPNPFSDNINVKYFTKENGSEIKILNTSGSQAYAMRLNETGYINKTLELSDLDQGSYFIHITTAEGTMVKTIVLMR